MIKGFKIFGAIFFLLGISIVFNFFQGITGFAVYENANLNIGFLIGAWFVLTGILLLVYRKKQEANKEHERK